MTTSRQDGSGAIRFQRPEVGRRDAARAYKLTVDGTEAARLKPGGTAVVTVAPGQHRVRARLDWTRSRELLIDVPAGGTVRIECAPSGGTAMTALDAIIKFHDYISLEVLPAE